MVLTPFHYQTMLKNCKDKSYLRLHCIKLAKEVGIRKAAQLLGCSRNTIRRWLRRYQLHPSLDSLKDLSKAPKSSRSPISQKDKDFLMAFKENYPNIGAKRLKRMLNLPFHHDTILKIWRNAGLIKKKRKKRKIKNDLRHIKRQWNLFQQSQVDTKYLNDIPHLWPTLKKFNLPTFLYSFREVVSGLVFFSFAYELSLSNSRIFILTILHHLKNSGVSFSPGSVIQTDNGSEFIGSWNASSDSAFSRTIHSVSPLRHVTIPPRAHTFQADVESFHRLIEDEFFDVESFSSLNDFLSKASAYLYWFNFCRTNSYKDHQTPWQIIHSRDPTISSRIVFLPPQILDHQYNRYLDSLKAFDYSHKQVGPHVIGHPLCKLFCRKVRVSSGVENF